ncbi:hypothetical protein ACH5RR_003479 [Cinchona calisaya]|uniref:RNase H type-1 domain-containing protein n=1 Tax=Cinchona calisaya TaxID=153742 RepID=A0ABD3AV40_9GENT
MRWDKSGELTLLWDKSGELTLLWAKTIDINIINFSQRWIDAFVSPNDAQFAWRLTKVYGEPDNSLRRAFWEGFRTLKNMSTFPGFVSEISMKFLNNMKFSVPTLGLSGTLTIFAQLWKHVNFDAWIKEIVLSVSKDEAEQFAVLCNELWMNRDAYAIIQQLNSDEDNLSNFAPLLNVVKSTLPELHSLSTYWINRKTKKLAHSFAQYATKSCQEEFLWNAPPYFVNDLLDDFPVSS